MPTIPEDDQEVDPADQDTLVFDSESDQSDNNLFDTAVDTTSDDSAIPMGKLVKAVHIPTEQVGCLQVTKNLQQFLDEYPPKSREKAFENICIASAR